MPCGPGNLSVTSSFVLFPCEAGPTTHTPRTAMRPRGAQGLTLPVRGSHPGDKAAVPAPIPGQWVHLLRLPCGRVCQAAGLTATRVGTGSTSGSQFTRVHPSSLPESRTKLKQNVPASHGCPLSQTRRETEREGSSPASQQRGTRTPSRAGWTIPWWPARCAQTTAWPNPVI